MKHQEPIIVFDKERASSYDAQYAKLDSRRDALNLFVHLVLADLPAEARILCVGVGTGAEMLDLAEAFPK